MYICWTKFSALTRGYMASISRPKKFQVQADWSYTIQVKKEMTNLMYLSVANSNARELVILHWGSLIEVWLFRPNGLQLADLKTWGLIIIHVGTDSVLRISCWKFVLIFRTFSFWVVESLNLNWTLGRRKQILIFLVKQD